jgi:hypothetical protein
MTNEATSVYNTQLKAGLGVIEETGTLLELWQPGMKSSELFRKALDTGSLGNVSATRLGDLITKCFFYRYLISGDYPAFILKQIKPYLAAGEFNQLLFIFTVRSYNILADFIKKVYWSLYASGHDVVSTEDARNFVMQAYREGKIPSQRSEYTLNRTASGLTGCCADFGLLESGSKSIRKILPFRIGKKVAAFLAYDLHFSGLGDNSVVTHPDWALFGLEEEEVREEFKQLALNGLIIFQAAGNIVRISWNYTSWEELIHAIAEG